MASLTLIMYSAVQSILYLVPKGNAPLDQDSKQSKLSAKTDQYESSPSEELQSMQPGSMEKSVKKQSQPDCWWCLHSKCLHITEWRLVILQAQGMLPWQSLVDVSQYLVHANYKNKRNFEVAIVFIFLSFNWSKVTKHFLRLIASWRNSKRNTTNGSCQFLSTNF